MSDQLKPPIILFGNVRSGTTMIHDLFDEHPDVRSWFEPRTVWTVADPRRPHDRFTAEDATPRVVRFVRRRFLEVQRRHGDRRVMEKTPSNVLRIPYVARILPEARFLYVVRHPLANVSSAEQRGRKALNRRRTLVRLRETPKTQLHHYLGRYVADHFKVKVLGRRPAYYGVRHETFAEDAARMDRFELLAHQWVACCRTADADLAELESGRCIRFRYEDFVERPHEHFERMLEHFELPMTPAIQAKLDDWVDPGRQQKWRRLDPDVLARVIPIVRDEMIRQGYEVPADLDPAATAVPAAGS